MIITPHASWYSDNTCQELREQAAEEMRRGLTNKVPEGLRYCVNREMLTGNNMNGALGPVNFTDNLNLNNLSNLNGLANLGNLNGLANLNNLNSLAAANSLSAANGANFFPMIQHSNAPDSSSLHNSIAVASLANHQPHSTISDLNSHIKTE